MAVCRFMQVTILLSPEDERRGFLGLHCGVLGRAQCLKGLSFELSDRLPRAVGLLLLPWQVLVNVGYFHWLGSRRHFCVILRAVSFSGSVCFITWSSLSGACCALGFQGDRNAPIHHRHQHAISLRALLLMFHFSSTPKPQEDENPGHFTWP